MAYEYRTSVEDGLLVARLGGQRHEALADNFRDLWAFWSEVSAEMKRLGIRDLIAVLSAQGAFRSLDVPVFYRRLGEMGFTADMRAAVVLEVPEHQRPLMQLAVSGAQRDGWNLRVCGSEEEARAWLRLGTDEGHDTVI